MQASDGIAVFFFFVLSITQASSWQHLQQKRLSSSSSNRVAAESHGELLPNSSQQQIRSVWSVDERIQKHRNNKLCIDDCKQRFACIFPHLSQVFTILSTTMLICLRCIHPEVSVAAVYPIKHDIQSTIYSISSKATINHEPIHSEPNLSLIDNNSNKLQRWMFQNGEVVLPEIINTNRFKLTHPQLLGSGAGGAVFAVQNEQRQRSESVIPAQVALKVSWKGSAKSVSNECQILNELQQASITKYGYTIDTIETCLSEVPYEDDVARTMIILQPVFNDEQASSLQDFDSEPDKLFVSVTLIIRTLLQMLSVDVITIDVQPLISRNTGQILFVDFTEAIIVNTKNAIEDVDKAAIRNFVCEMKALIPEFLHESVLSNIFLQEKLRYPIGSIEVNNILLEYF